MKQKHAFMLFFALVFIVNLGINFYLFSRTRGLFPAEHGTSRIIITIVFWMVAFAYFFGRIAERADAMPLAVPLIKTGSWWLGAMVYLTILFLLADILRGLNGLFHLSDFFRFGWSDSRGKAAILLIYSLSVIILAWGHYNARIPTVRRVSIQIKKFIPEGKQRVVLVSDIHLGVMISNGSLNKLVNLINREKADLVLLAGDTFDEDLGPVIQNNMGDLLKNITAKYGVYAILGNHEFYGDAPAAREYLENHNITVLQDSAVVLPNKIAVIGREDITAERMYGTPRKTLKEFMAGLDTRYPVFVLDHQPYNLDQTATSGADLQVSGHTHHGQMWPFNYITGSLFEISKGYGKIKDTHFYVSSGYGTWGPPIRTNSRSEIIVMEIIGKKDTE